MDGYYIFCDESLKRGRFYSNFYGGLIVKKAEFEVVKKESIYEVDSKKHILMQCIDVVLGAMAFRLNDLHKEKPKGTMQRGKRTIAKEKLYKHINKKIRETRTNFNIGKSTSLDGNYQNTFNNPYMHWIFTP